MATELLRASEAARRLGVPTKELLRLVRERQNPLRHGEWHRSRSGRCRRGVPGEGLLNSPASLGRRGTSCAVAGPSLAMVPRAAHGGAVVVSTVRK